MLDTKFWKRYFTIYDALNHSAPYQDLLDTVCKELDIKSGEKVLEAGCGTGNLAIKLKSNKGEVTGIDSSDAALEIYKGKDPDAKTMLVDIRNTLPFPDNHFDKIACNNTLYTMPEDIQFLCVKEFYRILKPGGKIVIANPKQGWSALKIYSETISSEIEDRGLFKTVIKVIKMVIPTVRIFYYNHQIKAEANYHFFETGEHERLLKECGFTGCYEKIVYAEQGILVGAYKSSNL